MSTTSDSAPALVERVPFKNQSRIGSLNFRLSCLQQPEHGARLIMKLLSLHIQRHVKGSRRGICKEMGAIRLCPTSYGYTKVEKQ